MNKIFISYRRQDTKAIAGRIFDRLEAKFGRDNVFMDIDSVPPGVDFQDWLNEQVVEAALVVALIGHGWADARDEEGHRRLDNPNDFVRVELEAAVSRNIPLIPLLIDGAPFPRGDELPEGLKPLTRRNAAFVDAGRDFNVHMARLIEALERHLSGGWSSPLKGAEPTKSPVPVVHYEDEAERLIRSFSDHWRDIHSVAFSPDGSFALSGSEDNKLNLWQVDTGKRLRSFFHDHPVYSVAFSPDGHFILSGGWEARLKLWEVDTGKELRRFDKLSNAIYSVAFSPDGHFALSGSYDEMLRLWDVQTAKELRSFVGHGHAVESVAFSPNGHFALSGSRDNTLKLWHLDTGKELRTFAGHSGTIESVAFSPDGSFALSGSWDMTVKLWDIGTGKEIRSFAHSKLVESVAFSPDGRFALSGGWEATLKLWDVGTGKELRSFAGHSRMVKSVVFSPNGRFVLSGGGDTLKLWDVSEWTQAK